MPYFAFLCTLLLCLPAAAQGQASLVVNLSTLDAKTDLAGKIRYFEDKSGKLNLSEAIAGLEKNSQTLPKAQANFYQSPSAFWFRLDIQYPKFEIEDWVIKIDYPLLDYVDLYYKDAQGKWQVDKSGDHVPFYQHSIKTKINAFKLRFHSQEAHTFYVCVKTAGILQIPFSLQAKEAYLYDNTNEESLMSTFYGLMIALSLYNLFLFFVLRDKAYIMYTIYMFSAIFFTGSLAGHTFQYLFFNYPFLVDACLVFTGTLMAYMLVSFIQAFLSLKTSIPYAHLYLQILKVLAVLDALTYFLLGNYTLATRLLNILSPLTVISVLFICFYAVYKKNPSAYFLILAFFGVMLGTSAYGFMQLGWLPYSLFIVHAPRLGIGFQGLIFSLALADRYTRLRKRLLDQEREANETLEGKVKARTAELELLHQELLAQHEELQQTQEEIMAQRDAIEVKNRELASQNSHIQNSIRAAKTIQKAIVPYQQKRDELLRDYFVIYRPRDVVSGDFYWLNKVGDSVFLAVIDCTGHGVPGAFMTMITNNLLDKVVRVWDIYSPAEILNRLHGEIEVVLRQKETENNYGMDMCIMVSTPQTNDTFKITFAGAKQNAYYIPKDKHTIQVLEGKRKSIGGYQRADIIFENTEIILEKGSQIYLTTDGYMDQNDIKRKRMGEKGFINFLTQIHTESMPTQKENLIKHLYNYMQDTVQRDDILVMGVKL